MIRPPCGSCLRICANAALAHRNIPCRLTFTTSNQLSSGISSIGPATPNVPALLNKTSNRPAVCANRSNAFSTAAGSVTSAGNTTTLSCSNANSCNASARRANTPTTQPLRKNSSAVARPMPELAPVIRIVPLIPHPPAPAPTAPARLANHPSITPPRAAQADSASPNATSPAPA